MIAFLPKRFKIHFQLLLMPEIFVNVNSSLIFLSYQISRKGVNNLMFLCVFIYKSSILNYGSISFYEFDKLKALFDFGREDVWL